MGVRHEPRAPQLFLDFLAACGAGSVLFAAALGAALAPRSEAAGRAPGLSAAATLPPPSASEWEASAAFHATVDSSGFGEAPPAQEPLPLGSHSISRRVAAALAWSPLLAVADVVCAMHALVLGAAAPELLAWQSEG